MIPRVFFRNKLWSNPFSRYSPKIPEPPEIVDEKSPEEGPEVVKLLREIRHYTKTREVQAQLRQDTLRSKLSELLSRSPKFVTDTAKTADLAFMQLYYLNKHSVENALDKTELELFFTQMCKSTATSQYESIAKIAEHYMSRDTQAIPKTVLQHIISMTAQLPGGSLQSSLTYLLVNKKSVFPGDFTSSFFEKEVADKTVSLSTFEAFVSASMSLLTFVLLDDAFYLHYIRFIDSMFEQNPPKPYEYEDQDRDIDRIQIFVQGALLQSLPMATVSSSTITKLLIHTWNLELINPTKDIDDTLQTYKALLEVHGPASAQINGAVFKEDLQDETLALSLLDLLWAKRDIFGASGDDLCSFIIADDIKFSPQVRALARLHLLLASAEDSTVNVLDHALTKEELLPEDYKVLYEKTIFRVASSESIASEVMEYFRKLHGIEPTLLVFKYRLDRAMEDSNHSLAMKIFDESTSNFTQWETESDARVFLTLNRLIVLTCEEVSTIEEIFPLFRKIRQQMVSRKIDVHAAKALAKKMLQEEYVGDLIEMLKRELPPIKRDDMVKLPTTGAAFAKNRELFDLLHNFIISYNNEETHETNWVLYGELHKYFDVPYESYLPAMKFFSEHNRSNASLVIFRQLKKLSELHGAKRHLPPLRDMYVFLFKDFGNKLYEEGVHEIHEYLKLDTDITQQDIELQNSILNAYSNLQDVPRVRDLFVAMSSLPKQVGGINEESVQIMLKTYTYSDMMYVNKFWNQLSLYGILPNYTIFKQYLIAHVYHGLVNEAFLVVDEMKEYDIEFSADLLLAMHNFCLETADQSKVKQWALEHHADEWELLESRGLLRSATNYVPEDNLITGSDL